MKTTHNILCKHLLAVSQLARRTGVLSACEQKLCEPAKIVPLAAKRRGTWSPITGSKQHEIMLKKPPDSCIEVKGCIRTATSKFSVRGRSLQQKVRSRGETLKLF